MKTTSLKDKEPITLRYKELKGGRKSLYLDYYQPGDKNHAHKYEFLKLYLLSDTRANKELNKEVLANANVILRQRLIDYANGKGGTPSKKGSKMLLLDYLAYYIEHKKAERRTLISYTSLANHLRTFGKNPTLTDIDKTFVLDFLAYLNNAKNLITNKPLGKTTAKGYYKSFTAVLNKAEKDGVIDKNPCKKVSADEKVCLKGSTKKIEYLTAEEVNTMAKAKPKTCKAKNTLQAFLFACFTGLRYSDVVSLTWEHIKQDAEGWHIEKVMQKTKELVIVPLSAQALKYIPARSERNTVFSLPCLETINYNLKRMAKAQGIDKNLHFHVSRHSFATMLLTHGADLYTVSKLLGHTDIKVTQVYAEIVNQKKVKAVELLNGVVQ